MFPNAMAYARWGSGPKNVILIPGGPGNSLPSGWALRMSAGPALDLLDEGYTVWLVMRRQGMPKDHSVEDMAADYADLIRDEFNGRVDVILGVSYGGIIAQYLAANHDDVFGHIVVAVAAHKVGDPSFDYEFAVQVSEGRYTAAYRTIVGGLFPRLPGLVAAPVGWLLARMSRGSFHEHHRSDYLVEGKAEVAFDSRDVLPSIKVPVLLINGDNDGYFPMALVEETARLIPNSTSVVYAGKGHIQAASDKRLAADILEFIRTHEGEPDE